ncbi:MAG: hypothetical protein ACO1OB_18235 [Archangium sp.]
MLSHELALLATLCLAGTDGGVDDIKAVFEEVEAAVAAKSLGTEQLQDCSGETMWEVTVFRDAAGAVRKLERVNGSEDHLQTVTSYFDLQGRLRFIFLEAGAVPDGHVEARWWFDDAGKVIKQKRKAWGEGPTYFGTELKPHLVKDPAAYVKKMKQCRAGAER